MKFDRSTIRSYMPLYLVSDRQWLQGRTLEEVIACAVQAGVTCVQLREKDMDVQSFIEEAFSLKEVCANYHIPFIINDNVEVAMAVDADGIHVGQQDRSAKEVRALLGDDKIIGVSAQTVEDAVLAQEQGADYLGVGAVFTTSTKNDADDVSLKTLNEIVAAVDIPVIAIGGINEQNILTLKGSGIDGVAVVSAILAQDNICEATQALHRKVEELLK